MAQTVARRRYNRRVAWLAVVYTAFLFLAVYGFSRHLIHGPAAYLAAIAPALPIIGLFGAIGRYLVEEQDEYVRLLMIRQSLWASAFALSVATVWGFLESFGLAGHVEAFYIAAVWFVGLGLGGLYNRLTLGDGGC